MIKTGSCKGSIPTGFKFDGWENIVRKHMVKNSLYPLIRCEDFMKVAQVYYKTVYADILVDLYEHHPERGGKL